MRRIWMVLMALALACGGSPQEKREKHYQRALSYIQEGKYEEALIELKNALQADPKFPQAHYYLGILQKRKGNLREAFVEFHRAA
ncbi:MAG TPA: tetratricopeptide repeat protein, partial [Firmicutes bacterium]|nr:tetratricopeptide repeat protein [Bacillota bacterium]